MRSPLFFLPFLLCTSLAAVAQKAPPLQAPEEIPPQGQVFFGPGRPFRVTVQSDRGVVMVLEIPQGVLLSVEYDDPRVPAEDHLTFRGDVTIRTRRGDEVAATESQSAHDIMLKAPVELALTQVVVVVEPMRKNGESPESE